MSLRDALPLRAVTSGALAPALRRWGMSFSCWVGKALLLGLALTLLAVECEVYGSFDEWRFELADCVRAFGTVLRSLAPAH